MASKGRWRKRLLLVVLLGLVGGGGCRVRRPERFGARALEDGWRLRRAGSGEPAAEALSAPGFDDSDWLQARVPTTVLAAEVASGSFPDLYMGTNLERVPKEPYAGPWWYRRELVLDPGEAAAHPRLLLEGVNGSAEVWVNGARLTGPEEVSGAFRRFDVDLQGHVRDGRNIVAVKVFPPKPGDFTIGFVDWNPRPPDANMGLWRPVELRTSGDVSLEDATVRTSVETSTLASANVRVGVRAVNRGRRPVRAVVRGELEGASFEQEVTLAAGEASDVVFEPQSYPVLRLASPRLWWPHTLGEPNLYQLHLEARLGSELSDRAAVTFGVREVGSRLTPEGHRQFTVNGRDVLIRGGGWTDDLLLADTPEKIDAQLAYVKHLGLNTVRIEGFWGSSQHLFDIADREGILVMAGWSCQWEWAEYLGKAVDERYGGVLTPEDMTLVTASLRDQVRWLRNHPSVFTWTLASDLLPHPDLERRYRAMLAQEDPTRPQLVSCAWRDSEVSGPSGVKMRGPYDWVPPVYWYADTEHGGAYGFNTETGPGPQPPPLESVRRMIPAEHLWPIDEVWEYHCGRNEFNTLKRYNEALEARYGPASSVEDYLRTAQVASYEAIRPMFEAFAVRRPVATGVIQWMLNSAWPEMYWQLYGHDLVPDGAFYGARAATRPVMLAYDYQRRTVHALNDTLAEVAGATARVRAFDLGSREVLSRTKAIDVPASSSTEVLSLADLEAPSPVYFLDLRLTGAGGDELARNFYWLPATNDVPDYVHSEWFVTPVKRYADMRALRDLPTAQLEVEAAGEGELRVRLANPGEHLAFFVTLRAVGVDGNEVVPVLWDDNDVSVLPGEERVLTARFPQARARPTRLEVSGFNVPLTTVPLGEGGSR